MANRIEVNNVYKSFGKGESLTKVLSGATLNVGKGEFVSLMGASGSGKSTLLYLIGGLDRRFEGTISICGNDISKMKEKEMSKLRLEKIGFIFQFYNLVPNLTVRENIEVCRYLTKDPLDMDELLNTLGLKEHAGKFPSQLSGGQQQRVAIARAVIGNPEIILADEPTGNLDSKSSDEIVALLKKSNKELKQTIIMITHNMEIAKIADRIIKIEDGKIVTEV